MMSHIRYCRLRDTDVIISPKRLHRPTELGTPSELFGIEDCPFEHGCEEATPNEIFSLRDKEGNWITRVIPNLYNALDIGEPKTSKRVGFYTQKSAFGAHEVIIETPSHEKKIDQYTLENWNAYLKTINYRVSDLRRDFRLEYIQVFKNHGFRAGATLSHPHSQIIATGFIPSEVKAELARCKVYYERHQRSLLSDMVHEELTIQKRIVYENNSFVAFVPYAALYPFELIIAPKEHYPDMTRLHAAELNDLSHVLKNCAKKLTATLGDFHYNMIFHNYPPIKEESHPHLFDAQERYYTFYIQIIPRIYMLAGFELASGMRINPVTPEMAAKKLKEVS